VIRILDAANEPVAIIGPTDEWEFEAIDENSATGMCGVLRRRGRASVSWRVGYVAGGHLSPPRTPIDAKAILTELQRSVNRDGEGDASVPVEIQGWIVPPSYSESRHALEWALAVRFRNEARPTLNHSVRILSRRGHVSLDAAAPTDRAAELKNDASAILALVKFSAGRGYESFDPRTEAFGPSSALDLLTPAARARTYVAHSGPGRRASIVVIVLLVGVLIWAPRRWRESGRRRHARRR
jgi:uncharacterized membrane-anchored protein